MKAEKFPFQYGLTFGDNATWKFYFSSDLEDWGAEFSTILGLDEIQQECDHKLFFNTTRKIHSIFFTLKASNNSTKGEYLQYFSFDWMTMNYDPMTTIYHAILPALPEEENRINRYVQMLSALFPLYRETIKSGGLVVHSAFLNHPELGGIGILAPGGTGKSTCAQRVPPPWTAWSDDHMLVVKETNTTYYAHPLPTWSNFVLNKNLQKRWQVHQYRILKGLFFLQKADHDSAVSLSKTESAQWLYDSSMQSMERFVKNMTIAEQLEMKRKIFMNACDMAQCIPSAILKATRHGSFWSEIETILAKDQANESH